MGLANALFAYKVHFDFLAWSHLGDEDVVVEWFVGLLVALGHELEITRVNVGVVV